MRVVTLPKGAAFSDAEKELVMELPADAPADAAAMIQYTYNTRKSEASIFWRRAWRPRREAESARKARTAWMEADGAEDPDRADGFGRRG